MDASVESQSWFELSVYVSPGCSLALDADAAVDMCSPKLHREHCAAKQRGNFHPNL